MPLLHVSPALQVAGHAAGRVGSASVRWITIFAIRTTTREAHPGRRPEEASYLPIQIVQPAMGFTMDSRDNPVPWRHKGLAESDRSRSVYWSATVDSLKQPTATLHVGRSGAIWTGAAGRFSAQTHRIVKSRGSRQVPRHGASPSVRRAPHPWSATLLQASSPGPLVGRML